MTFHRISFRISVAPKAAQARRFVAPAAGRAAGGRSAVGDFGGPRRRAGRLQWPHRRNRLHAVIDDASRPADDRVKAMPAGASADQPFEAGFACPTSRRARAQSALRSCAVAARYLPAQRQFRFGARRYRSGDRDRAEECSTFLPAASPKRPEGWTEAPPISTRRSRCARTGAGPCRTRAPGRDGAVRSGTRELTRACLNPTCRAHFFGAVRLSPQRRHRSCDEDFFRAIARLQTSADPNYARAQLFSAKAITPRRRDFDRLVSLAPTTKEFQQQRQSAIAMQTELPRDAKRRACASPAPVPGGGEAVPPPPTPRCSLVNQQIDQSDC